MKAITIQATREGYTVEQVARNTMTLADLIDVLQEMQDAYGEETPVVVSNDNGYTYGPLSYDSIQCEGGEDW